MTKRKMLLLLYIAVLALLYAGSFGISRSYKAIEKAEAKMVRELPSTDLSWLARNAVNDCEGLDFDKQKWCVTSGEPRCMYLYPYPVSWNEDNYRQVLGEINPRIIFGNNYIEAKEYGSAGLIIYIDRENRLILMFSMSTLVPNKFGEAVLKRYVPEEYEHYTPISDYTGGFADPIAMTRYVSEKLKSGYTIFSPRNYGFTKFELITLPIYYSLFLLPLMALGVYRNSETIKLNVVLAAVYVVWNTAAMLIIGSLF